MSLQAELCVQILMPLYAEFDQRSGWVTRADLLKHFTKEGIAQGRTEDALSVLESLKMIEIQDNSIKLTRYGIDWIETKMPMISRGEEYQFSMPVFGSLKLEGPDSFYRKLSKERPHHSSIDWAKWGTIFAGLSIIVAILIAVVT